MPLLIVGALLVVIIVIAAVAGTSSDDDRGGSTKAGGSGKSQLEEVTISKCGPPDAIGVVYVRGIADNGSSKRSDYLIDVTVEAPDGTQIGTGSAIAQNVDPGQKAVWRALTDVESDAWVDGAVCKVVKVERNASL
jgi:hypothetical protein